MKIIQSGSDRTFLIIKDKVVLVDPNKENLIKYLRIRSFLEKNLVNVPKVFSPTFCPNGKEFPYTFAILQNLGDNFFQVLNTNFLNANLRKKQKNDINLLIKKYKQILDEISKVHNIKISEVTENEIFGVFDLKVLRWEWKYFIENFLVNYLGVRNLNKWFEISEVVINTCYEIFKDYPAIIHRDLQSTNVIFYKNKPYFIDFQGMMIGNFLYDLASLLEDPYIMLPGKIKKILLEFYFKNNSHVKHLANFYKYYKIQRLIQVLGAFAFLSIHKAKPFFIKQLKKYPKIIGEILQTAKSL